MSQDFEEMKENIRVTGNAYVTKDSGERIAFDSGMVRDSQAGKPRYDLLDRAFLRRWAELMARGAEKYGEDNWRHANSEEEIRRFESSALRHLMQWLDGDTDEDHAAAVAFNLAAAESTRTKLAELEGSQPQPSGLPEQLLGTSYLLEPPQRRHLRGKDSPSSRQQRRATLRPKPQLQPRVPRPSQTASDLPQGCSSSETPEVC